MGSRKPKRAKTEEVPAEEEEIVAPADEEPSASTPAQKEATAEEDPTEAVPTEAGPAATEAEPTSCVPAVDEEAVVEDVVLEAVAAVADTNDTRVALTASGKRKRLCRYPGCTKVIKSQGHCQRHGARAKRCKVEGCEKQAQGTHDGMCKRHWKALNFPPPPPKPESIPPPPQGASVYDTILPASVSYRPLPAPALKTMTPQKSQEEKTAAVAASPAKTNVEGEAAATPGKDTNNKEGDVVLQQMPLIEFLQHGASLEAGWHRNAERRARGVFPVASLSSQLEPWERQLALLEIFLLSGGTPQANFQDLAHAWGREKGFHQILVNNVCERRGEVERKKRSDAGRTYTPEEKEAFREKLKSARLSSGKEASSVGQALAEEAKQQEEKEQAVEQEEREQAVEQEVTELEAETDEPTEGDLRNAVAELVDQAPEEAIEAVSV